MRRSKHKLSRPFVFVRAATRQLCHVTTYKVLLLLSYKSRTFKYPVYFYPELPHPYTVCYKIFHRLGIPIKKGLPHKTSCGLVFVWEDTTFMPALELTKKGTGNVFVNLLCLDISKEKVEAVHQTVFGYSLEVNPLIFSGKIVMKSNSNGAHDGKEILGPIKEVLPGFVYQRVVNNSTSLVQDGASTDHFVYDIRVPIFAGNNASYVYLKYRPINDRFSNTNALVRIVETDSIFNDAEREKLRLFCLRFHLDYGEIDVVRDANDCKIYVLDVNKTPLGPPNGLSSEGKNEAIRLYSQAFLDWLEKIGSEFNTNSRLNKER